MGDEDWLECIDILEHFESYPYCWTMESLAKIFYLLDKDKFLEKGKYKSYKFYRKDFDVYKIANLEIDLCMDDLSKSFDETKECIDEFIKIWDTFRKESTNFIQRCNCILVIKIKELYTILQKNKESIRPDGEINTEVQEGDADGDGIGREITLETMYIDICFNDKEFTNKSYYWKRDKLDVLIFSSRYLDLYKATILLTSGTALVDEGWYTDGKPETRWPLNYLLNLITNRKGEIVQEYIKFYAKVIGFGFSAFNYNDYLVLLLKTKGFEGKQCELEIMEKLLDTTDYYSQYVTYFWKSRDKKQFNVHVELLVKMYIDSGATGCKSILIYLGVIENAVRRCPWEVYHTNKLIEQALSQKLHIQKLPNLLFFCISVTEAITKFKDETPKDFIWPPNDEQKIDFRITFFSNTGKAEEIANEDNLKLLENNFEALLDTYKKVLSWSVLSTINT